uniref:MACPF domain-containing protein n=1 Tax=Poecilia formosa TaxID=48698 RepID=A0A096M410_POEFO
MLPDSTSALLLSVLLVHSSVLSCRTGTQIECDAAPFVPGHNLMGQGFDIVTLERKRAHVIDVKTYLTARHSCIVCSNPLQNDVYQKVINGKNKERKKSKCVQRRLWRIARENSMKTLAAITDESHINKKVCYEINLHPVRTEVNNFDVGGTGSNTYKFVSQKIEEDRYTFSIHSVTCIHYGIVLSSKPPLSLEFKQQVDLLPSQYNYSTKNEYRKLIQTYGTHYVRMVNLGGRLRRVTSSRSCLSSMNGLTSSQVHNCLSMGFAVGLGKMKLSSIQKPCIRVLLNKDFATGYSSGLHQHFTEVSGGNGWLGEFSIFKNDSMGYMNWLKSLKEHPDVVSYSLRPLYQLIPSKEQKAEIKAAIEHYLEDNALWTLPEEPHCEGKTPDLSSNCCPLRASRGTLSVTIVQGWNLYGDEFSVTDGYAKMYYGSIQRRTKMIESNRPRWDAEFNLGKLCYHPH